MSEGKGTDAKQLPATFTVRAAGSLEFFGSRVALRHPTLGSGLDHWEI